jgi:hypothetical protein
VCRVCADVCVFASDDVIGLRRNFFCCDILHSVYSGRSAQRFLDDLSS